MRVLEAAFRHFRGFRETTLTPRGHVVLVGEPGAGRTDVLEGLERVLSPELTRMRAPVETDFFETDTSKRAEVELVLGDLGLELEQVFFYALEVWDRTTAKVLDELPDPDAIDRSKHELVVRLCYRATWNSDSEQGEHWVDYPKLSEPAVGQFSRVSRADRLLLGFASLDTRSKALDIGARGGFRRLVERAGGSEFSAAIVELESSIRDASSEMTESSSIFPALLAVFSPVMGSLGLSDETLAESATFVPEGGSVSGLLRTLQLSLRTGISGIPLDVLKHGSTTNAVLQVAQGLALAGRGGVLAIDDFGEGMSGAMARHLASIVRKGSSQCWISTRRADAISAFQPEELIRLSRDGEGHRVVRYGAKPKSRAERRLARHLGLQLLPALASKALIVLEGNHDMDSYAAVAERLLEVESIPLPASMHIGIAHAGAVDGAGGASVVPELCKLAQSLGFRVIAVLDNDGEVEQAKKELAAALASAHCVIRLPAQFAVERALVAELGDATLRAALGELKEGFGAELPANVATMSGKPLEVAAAKIIKIQKGGLHLAFVESLPSAVVPPVARAVLGEAIGAANDRAKSGLISL